MKRKTILMLCITALAVILLSTTAFAIDESEVESAIAASSREEVAGNVFIWFLCAVAFLKVSQKIDSFMTSLGINVGRTGGSMLGELMIAGRAIGAAARTTGVASGGAASGGSVFNRFSSSNSTTNRAAGQGFTGGGGTGIFGAVQRAAGNSAVASATGNASGLRNTIGNAMYTSSMKNNGKFAADVVSTVATGNIASVGTISGPQASEALKNYLGYGPAGTNAAASTAKQSSVSGSAIIPGQAHETYRSEAGATASSESSTAQSTIHTGAPGSIPSSPGAGNGKGASSSPQSGGGSSASHQKPGGNVSGFESADPIPTAPKQSGNDVITPDGGAAAGAEYPYQSGHSSTPSGDSAIPMSRNASSKGGSDVITPVGGAAGGAKSQRQSGPGSSPSGGNAIPMSKTGSAATTGGGDVITPNGGAAAAASQSASGPEPGNSIPTSPPTFRDVEIGGGRITGYETPSGGGPERQFAMYNTAQYMEPTGNYEKVQTVDGQSWYKQYAEPTVQKTPYETDSGSIKYDEKIVEQLPQIPKRKDRV